MPAKRFFVLFAALSMLPLCAGAADTLIGKNLEKLRAAPPPAPDAFDFVVVGDSNTLKPLEQSEVFKQCIREFNILRPNLVVEIGDLVVGGAAEGVPAQWDLFEETIAACEPPYLPLPGNHDISDAATEALWRERMGPTHYAFEYGNACFILLNSEEVEAVGRISDAQTAWLKMQLEATRADHIFVFLHRPYFEHAGDPATADEYWARHWSNVAALFEGRPVRAVFAGHRHQYRHCGERDGVRYVICGGASVYGMHGTEAEGNFNHYLLVRVRGDDVSWSVIKPGAVLPEDAVTSARMDELYNIRNKWIDAGEVKAPLGAPVAAEMRITLHNPHGAALRDAVTWETPPGWSVTPMAAEYTAEPAGSAVLPFTVRAAAEDARYPVPVFRTRYTQTQHGPPADVEQPLKFVPMLKAARAPDGMAVDGGLAEWGAAEWAPLTYPAHFDGPDAGDLASKLAFLWNNTHLYLAVDTTDNEFHQPYAGDIVWSADNVEMFLDAWSWGLSLTEDGPEVFLYWGIGVPDETVNTDVDLAVTRQGTRVIYEAAFPKSVLTPLELAPDNRFRFNAIMNDLDPSGPVEDRHWLELLPGAGSVGRAAPRIEVVLGK